MELLSRVDKSYSLKILSRPLTVPTPRVEELAIIGAIVIDQSPLNKVLNQGTADEIAYISSSAMQAYLAHYHSIMDEMPPPDISATIEQVTALEYTIAANRAPYADFAIFGPHGVRGQRKMQLTGLVMHADGLLRPI